ncbi:MAG: hypothetical protein ABI461_21495 [Polyangiaceae bacterium]
MTSRSSAKGFARVFSVGVVLCGVGFCVLPGCSSSPSTPTLNKLAVAPNDQVFTATLPQNWSIDASGDDEATLVSVDRDSSGGLTAQEGQAGTVTLLPLFDDPSGNSQTEFASLGGQLHVVASAPDILETTVFKGSATNAWQLLGIAKKQGHVDLIFTIDGHPGSVTAGVDVVAQTALSNSDDDGGTDGGS